MLERSYENRTDKRFLDRTTRYVGFSRVGFTKNEKKKTSVYFFLIPMRNGLLKIEMQRGVGVITGNSKGIDEIYQNPFPLGEKNVLAHAQVAYVHAQSLFRYPASTSSHCFVSSPRCLLALQALARRAKVSMLATPLPDTPTEPPTDSDPAPGPELVYGESTTRSFVKALVWRLTAGVVTLVRGVCERDVSVYHLPWGNRQGCKFVFLDGFELQWRCVWLRGHGGSVERLPAMRFSGVCACVCI